MKTKHSNWKPIKTAPKDGDPVLLAEPECEPGEFFIFVGYYELGCWQAVAGDGDDQNPTWWMPLPEMPKEFA